MQQRQVEGMRVAIIAANDFEESELTERRKALDGAGAKTTVISLKEGQIQDVRHDEKGGTVGVDMTLEAANPDDFDGLLLPGGALNADSLRMLPKAQEFVRRFDSMNKPIAVICHGPWLLVSSGLVHGRTLTSYHTIQDDIRNAGGHWLDMEMVRDRNWVSSRSPNDLPAFNHGMLELFGQSRTQRSGQTDGSLRVASARD